MQLIHDLGPMHCIRQRVLLFFDHRPLPGQLRIQLQKLLLTGGQLILGIDCVDRAFGNAHIAVDTFFGIDDQKVWPLMKAGYGANRCTVGILAANAAADLGLIFNPLSTPGTDDEVSCPYLENWVYIDPDGKINPCPHWDTAEPLGNLNRQSFSEIWEGPVYQELRNC